MALVLGDCIPKWQNAATLNQEEIYLSQSKLHSIPNSTYNSRQRPRTIKHRLMNDNLSLISATPALSPLQSNSPRCSPRIFETFLGTPRTFEFRYLANTV